MVRLKNLKKTKKKTDKVRESSLSEIRELIIQAMDLLFDIFGDFSKEDVTEFKGYMIFEVDIELALQRMDKVEMILPKLKRGIEQLKDNEIKR